MPPKKEAPEPGKEDWRDDDERHAEEVADDHLDDDDADIDGDRA